MRWRIRDRRPSSILSFRAVFPLPFYLTTLLLQLQLPSLAAADGDGTTVVSATSTMTLINTVTKPAPTPTANATMTGTASFGGLLPIATGIPSSSPDFSFADDVTFAAGILDAVNRLRAKHDAQPVVWNATLATYAGWWANGCNFTKSVSGAQCKKDVSTFRFPRKNIFPTVIPRRHTCYASSRQDACRGPSCRPPSPPHIYPRAPQFSHPSSTPAPPVLWRDPFSTSSCSLAWFLPPLLRPICGGAGGVEIERWLESGKALSAPLLAVAFAARSAAVRPAPVRSCWVRVRARPLFHAGDGLAGVEQWRTFWAN